MVCVQSKHSSNGHSTRIDVVNDGMVVSGGAIGNYVLRMWRYTPAHDSKKCAHTAMKLVEANAWVMGNLCYLPSSWQPCRETPAAVIVPLRCSFDAVGVNIYSGCLTAIVLDNIFETNTKCGSLRGVRRNACAKKP